MAYYLPRAPPPSFFSVIAVIRLFREVYANPAINGSPLEQTARRNLNCVLPQGFTLTTDRPFEVGTIGGAAVNRSNT